jgi:hypothetical protein
VPGEKKTPTDSPALLLLLDGNPTLQKLIATWPNAWRAGAKKHEQIATWAALTGLREVEVEASWRTLFDNGFVDRDGTVDEFAAKYLASIAMGRLPAGVRERKAKPKKEAEGA